MRAVSSTVKKPWSQKTSMKSASPFVRHARNHLVDDQVDIVLLVAAVLHGDAVGAEEVGLDGQGRVLLEAADDAQELQLALGGEAVAALDFDGAGAEAHGLFEAALGHVVEFLLRGRRRGFGRIEDTPSPLRDLLVAEAANLVDELMLARVGIDEVGVRVAEGREDEPSRGVHFFFHIPLSVFRFPLAHRSEGLYPAVLNEEVGVLDGLHLRHLLALGAQLLLAGLHLHQFLDILDKCSHIIGTTLIKLGLLINVLTIASANADSVFAEIISTYSDSISLDTHNSNLPSRKSVHTSWYGLREGSMATRQLVSRTIRLILIPDMGYANFRESSHGDSSRSLIPKSASLTFCIEVTKLFSIHPSCCPSGSCGTSPTNESVLD